jgi:hypothetical protein
MGIDDYNREWERLQQETKDKSEFEHHLKSKEFIAVFERRRKAVGYHGSEFYDQFTKDPACKPSLKLKDAEVWHV